MQKVAAGESDYIFELYPDHASKGGGADEIGGGWLSLSVKDNVTICKQTAVSIRADHEGVSVLCAGMSKQRLHHGAQSR